MLDYQGIGIEGKSFKLSSKDQTLQEPPLGGDANAKKNTKLSKCVNTYSLSDSLMQDSSPPVRLEPKDMQTMVQGRMQGGNEVR